MTRPGDEFREQPDLPPVDDAALRHALASFERARDPNWLYDAGADPHPPHPYQGDVLPDVPMAFVGTDLRARVLRTTGLLLSHGCDLPGDDGFAVFAPVFPVALLASRWRQAGGDAQARSRTDALRRNTFTPYVYLPAFPPALAEESYADMSRVATVPGGVVETLADRRDVGPRLRLSQNGWYVLVLKLQMHWCRMERAADYPRAGRAP